MSLSLDEIQHSAAMLLEAERTRVQCELLSQKYPKMDMDDAYAIQAELVAQKIASGRTVKGWKIGLTSKAMQYALNIDIPDSGVLLDDMFFEDVVPAGRFIQPRIEAEICFVLNQDLKGIVSRSDVIAATDYVAPSIEILDTRIMRMDPTTGAVRNVLDTISDNAANAGIVVGAQRHAVADFDLRWVGAIVSRNGEVEETGLGAGVLNDPIEGIVWLCHRLAQYDQGLSAGDTVLSGSFIRPIEAPSGAEFLADFGPFGAIELRFE